ncbi:MAG: hypothetical protein H5T70_11360 [Chloroflexi bacterium]|nr:hypothetical protein [Chloroflexota bacterium]
MFRTASSSTASPLSARQGLIAGALFLFNLVCNIVSNTSFKLSAASSHWKGFLTWQVVGNLTGFLGVLSLTGLLRLVPLHVAYPLTVGLAVVGVQVVAAGALFRETISPAQWVGTGLIVLGILLIGGH